ncbi:asparagine--tRNA ligase [Candidatus Peregrinibacteria bacterium CG22_combo_CG10-13_8_21_14_all_44_10]|nr:MAG: asparagine--tRNA ligase [Candidatus Peregrinibacteria bacterium CG2_30_44_17]PIP66174.1 MAG: asparagine--tRNA ligase [Candidatus Peregrinibacteria bacterium CG22_combo_CG10-13_8_21_14_all_44_10]PIS03901.1 MAG: asparagine--tRNA ligase [Candidatus Peregrinibacteria bacterium CG10_big_fil_rev_8_21_14_0_10_44_7]PIX79996.1 MAG: asparagine--tRNA ligase [Candidatus Peregrinibacteria bacterium CG_4_10_14_3_um_filter_44_21]PJB88979.1 MAG: asparagine--tRNA ligase [Candidatus Peregrinibacteria bac
MFVRISDLRDHVDQEVTIQGWMYNKRGSGKIYFLQLRDGSGMTQGVVTEPELLEKAERLTIESACKVTGKVSKHPKQEDVFELQVTDIEIVSIPPEDYPISKKEHGPDFLLDNRHLWLRSGKQWAIQRVRDCIITAVYDYFHENGFIKIDTPIFTPNACEGATTLFELEYFDEGKVFLSQSGQLYLEAAIMSVGRAFDFGPVFRAEKSKTRKHLAEFWMMDAEAAYVEHEESMRIQENMVVFIIQRCLERCKKELEVLERDTEPLKKIKTPFKRMTYSEAIPFLQSNGSEIKFGDDLGAPDEELLTQDSEVPVFIHKWPKSIKPFYMKVDPENPELVLNNDLIGVEGAGEIIGGSQREDDYETLKAAIEHEGLAGPEYQWYLDLRKFGGVPHSGFGLGLERMVRWVTGIEHIRETIPFPRMMTRCRP